MPIHRLRRRSVLVAVVLVLLVVIVLSFVLPHTGSHPGRLRPVP